MATDMCINVPQVMTRLGLSRGTVYELINTGQLRSFKIGSRRMITEQALRDFIELKDRG
jgi:excisionase family DNA binding protein